MPGRGSPKAEPPLRAGTGARRIAAGTLVQAGGEVAGRLASLALFVAIARELGEGGLGDFVFGTSVAAVLFTFAGFGTDQVVAREVARDRQRAHDLLANVVVLKLLISAALLPLMAAAVTLSGQSAHITVALVLLGTGVAIEIVTKSVYAVLQAYERFELVSASLVLQRTLTAAAGIAVLVRGGDLLGVGVVVAAGALIGLLSAVLWLYGRVARPRLSVERSRWAEIARAGIPVGLAIALYAVLLRLDAALLGFLKDSAAVGAYGAAFRIVMATTFVPWAFAAAALPWLSRQVEREGSSLARAYELGLKGLVAILLPVATAVVLYAEPVVELLYGLGFNDAVTPLRILAPIMVLYGVNSFTSTLMISRGRASEFARPAAFVLAQNALFNLVLIPPLGATGAALNATLSGALLAGLTERRAARVAGRVSFARVLLAPVAASGALAAVIASSGFELDPYTVAAGVTAWVVALVAVERLAFRDDFQFFAALVRRAPR